jgi:hypothetical protein
METQIRESGQSVSLRKEKKQKKKRVHLGVTKTSPTEEKVTHVG